MLNVREPKHYGLIGQSINHSLSSYIHQYFSIQTQQNILYHNLESTSESFSHDLRQFLHYGQGINVTAPFKQLAFKLANEVSEAAKLAQAVNTLTKCADNSIKADNTDGLGFVHDLTLNHGFSLNNKRILILGAGGASRGILGPLLNENPQRILIANRSFEHALTLAKYFKVEAIALEKLVDDNFELIIQASSVLPMLPSKFVAENAVCYDLNYGKKSSIFRRWSRERHNSYLDGIGMLVEQAAESFFIWHGVRPTTTDLITELRKSAK